MTSRVMTLVRDSGVWTWLCIYLIDSTMLAAFLERVLWKVCRFALDTVHINFEIQGAGGGCCEEIPVERYFPEWKPFGRQWFETWSTLFPEFILSPPG